MNFNNDQKNNKKDKRRMDLNEELLFSLERSCFDDLRTKDKFIVARKISVTFKTLYGIAYKLMDLAKKGTMKIINITVYLKELNII